jgi:ATP-binding cassette subfamily C protein
MLTTFLKAVRSTFAALRFASRFGRRRLAVNFAVILINGVVQVMGVASIAPFLAVASSEGHVSWLGKVPVAGTWMASLAHRELLTVMGFATILGLFFANLLMWLTERVRLRYGAFLVQALRKGLMANYCARPYGYYLATNSAVLLKRVTLDIFQFVNGVLVPALEIISRLVVLLLLLVLLLVVAPGITLLVAALCGLIYGGSLAVLNSLGRRFGQQINAANRDMLQAAQQFFGAIKAVLLHGKAPYFTGQFLDASATLTDCSARAAVLGNLPRYLLEPVAYGILVVVVLVYASKGNEMATILPKLSILAVAGYRLLPSFQAVYGQAMNMLGNSYTLKEVADCANQGAAAVGVPQVPVHFANSLRLDGIAFSYPGALAPVIRGLSMDFPKDSKTGIIGPTGCGKSTLVDLILGLHSPTEGRLLVDGVPLGVENIASWRALVGYVPQDIYLLDDTIAANIAFGVPEANRDLKKVREAANAAHILGFVENELPHGFATMVGERGVRLSGGQRQRIGIARALYHGPEVLVLDEATSSLDSETEKDVMDAIYELSGQITMIMIAHRRSSLDRCDRLFDLSRVEASYV